MTENHSASHLKEHAHLGDFQPAQATGSSSASPPGRGDIQSGLDDGYGLDDEYSDSAYEEEFSFDDTKSLSTYITKYRFENGRRYHSYRDGAYWVGGRLSSGLLYGQ